MKDTKSWAQKAEDSRRAIIEGKRLLAHIETLDTRLAEADRKARADFAVRVNTVRSEIPWVFRWAFPKV